MNDKGFVIIHINEQWPESAFVRLIIIYPCRRRIYCFYYAMNKIQQDTDIGRLNVFNPHRQAHFWSKNKTCPYYRSAHPDRPQLLAKLIIK